MKSVNPCHLKSEGHFHPRGRQYSAKTQAKDKHTSSLDQELFYFLLTETRNKDINLMLQYYRDKLYCKTHRIFNYQVK